MAQPPLTRTKLEVGFTLGRGAEFLQLAFGVSAIDVYGELFTAASPEWSANLPAGSYQARLRLSPNYLREGMYSVTLKMFVDGALV